MSVPTITADYVVKGAGAVGMAFVDSVFSETDATFVIVDRHDRPGGHWNDAYPFVRLHQPASSYGVTSTPLGTEQIDRVGLNAGFEELASGPQVLGHFDQVMRQRLLPSGRVHFLPMSQIDDDGEVTSLVSGQRCRVEARRTVDATHSRMSVPSTTVPPYTVAPEATCVPLNELPRRAAEFDTFVVIGAGKTGMDACIWLLDNGAEPHQIRWVMPRDSWVLHRGNFQPGADNFARLCKSIADQVEAVAVASTPADVFAWLEAAGELHRIDPSIDPGAYHCAILSDGELAMLRRLDGIVRLGRVVAIHADRIELEQGDIPTDARCLHVDCSAAGIPSHSSKPVFEGDRITPQWIRTCQPTFSAALIGFVESTFDDDATKNRICTPIVPPTVPLDWLRMLRVELDNRACWIEFPQIDEWMAGSRLDPFVKTSRTQIGVDAEATEHLGRYLTNIEPARAALDRLLDTSE